MRTKTLLLSAAAVVAGIISAQAQSNVFSANVVGYVTVTNAANAYALYALPLDSGSNTLSGLFPSSPIGAQILIWNGAGYTGATKTPTTWTPNPTLVPGQGFFYKANANGTNTFVGSIVVPNGGSITNSFANGIYSLVGSPIPYTDTLAGTNLNLLANTGSQVLIWNGTTASYSGSTRSPTTWNPNFTITPGHGFFVKTTANTNWVQTLNLQ
jgi:hypothetical protein